MVGTVYSKASAPYAALPVKLSNLGFGVDMTASLNLYHEHIM
jgi:hypothetical protein